MVTIKKATAKDAEKVLFLLSRLDSRKHTKEDWRRLFEFHWNNNQDYCGYVMYDGDKAVGFLGLLFSQRTLQKKESKFCNVSSWVVNKEYRRQSLHLLLPVLKLHDYTITVLTCNAATYFITKKLGFQDLEFGQRIICPLPSLPKLMSSSKLTFDDKEIEKKLKGEPLKIYHDHKKLECFHVIIKNHQGFCYVVGSRTLKRSLPLAHVHYISDLKFFIDHIGRVSGRFSWQMKVVGILIDERLLQGEKIFPSIYFNMPYPRVYKSDMWGNEEVDLLYSEYQVLNL